MTRILTFLAMPFALLWDWHRREETGRHIVALQRQRTLLLDNLERRRR